MTCTRLTIPSEIIVSAYSQLSPPPRGNFSSSQSPRPSNPMRMQARNTNSARGFYSQQTSLPNAVRPIRVLNVVTEPENQAHAAILDDNYPTEYSSDTIGAPTFYEEWDVEYNADNYNFEASM